MGERHALQDSFLNSVRKAKCQVTIFLVSGHQAARDDHVV